MTQRNLTLVLAGVTLLLGLGHLVFTTLIYDRWTADALWFVGTGFAIVIGAAANIPAMNVLDRPSRSIIAIINAMMTGFFVAAWSVIPVPQVIAGGVLFAGLTVCALRTVSPSTPRSAE